MAGRLVGNFPQAFSHVSLVNSASKITGYSKPTYQTTYSWAWPAGRCPGEARPAPARPACTWVRDAKSALARVGRRGVAGPRRPAGPRRASRRRSAEPGGDHPPAGTGTAASDGAPQKSHDREKSCGEDRAPAKQRTAPATKAAVKTARPKTDRGSKKGGGHQEGRAGEEGGRQKATVSARSDDAANARTDGSTGRDRQPSRSVSDIGRWHTVDYPDAPPTTARGTAAWPTG